MPKLRNHTEEDEDLAGCNETPPKNGRVYTIYRGDILARSVWVPNGMEGAFLTMFYREFPACMYDMLNLKHTYRAVKLYEEYLRSPHRETHFVSFNHEIMLGLGGAIASSSVYQPVQSVW